MQLRDLQHSRHACRMTAAGETVTCVISARRYRNTTGVILEVGRTYRITAHGRWKDWNRLCDAYGYTSDKRLLKIAEQWRREPRARWFALVGRIREHPSHQFVLGRDVTVSPEVNGELVCFANDVRFMYWNNCGTLTLTITMIR